MLRIIQIADAFCHFFLANESIKNSFFLNVDIALISMGQSFAGTEVLHCDKHMLIFFNA
eukprot:UN24382